MTRCARSAKVTTTWGRLEYHVILDSLADAIIVADLYGRIVYLNLAAERLLGWTRAEVTGQLLHVLMPEHLHEAHTIGFERFVKTREPKILGQRVRVPARTKRGAELEVELTLSTFKDKDGELCVIATMRDAELGMFERIDTILRGISDGITVQRGDGTLVYANDAAAQLTDFESARAFMAASNAEVIGRFELLGEDEKPVPIERLPSRIALTGTVAKDVLVCFRIVRTGETRWSIVTSTPILNSSGGVSMVATVFRDVTQARKAETSLRFLAEASAVLGSTLDFRETLQNLAQLAVPLLADWCSIALATTDGRVGPIVAVSHVDPAKVAWAKDALEKYPPDPSAPRGLYHVLRSGMAEIHHGASDASGLLRSLDIESAMLVPLKAHGRLLGIVSFFSNQTACKYGQSDLELATSLAERAAFAVDNARLYAAEKLASEQLQQLAKQAEEASRVKDEFLATVSHELRTPLNAIMGWASLLRERTRTRGDGFVAKGVDVIHRNAKAQGKLIEDILDVSRIITGTLRIEPRSTDFVTCVADAIEVVRPSANAKHIDIVFEPAPTHVFVVADPERLQQVVWNLLSNAVKFTDPDGRITLELGVNETHVTFSVIDSGQGIDPDFLPYVFDRFKQADGSTTRRVGGLGLGLSIVRHIVELHGGNVHAASDGLGKGATFTIVIPVSSSSAGGGGDLPPDPTPKEAPVPQAPSLVGLRILVVDDDRDARELLLTVLSQAGGSVEVASSAKEGFERLRTMRPHVLVSDIGMPEEDGYSFLRRIRALGPSEGGLTPAIALTAYSRAGDKARALEAGYALHITKPLTVNDFLNAVRDVATSTR